MNDFFSNRLITFGDLVVQRGDLVRHSLGTIGTVCNPFLHLSRGLVLFDVFIRQHLNLDARRRMFALALSLSLCPSTSLMFDRLSKSFL